MGPVTGNDDGTTYYGVEGTSQSATGVVGTSGSGVGVSGQVGTSARRDRAGFSPQAGVVGYGSDAGNGATFGVYGESQSAGDGVYGLGANGVHGASGLESGHSGAPPPQGAGVWGESRAGCGVYGSSTDYVGVVGNSASYDGVQGISSSPAHAGVSARNVAPAPAPVPGVSPPSGYALWAYSNATGVFAVGNPAGYFRGDVQVTGDVILLNPGSGDVAEDFDVEGESKHMEPGTVLVINPAGTLSVTHDAYDTRVAGVISGAGGLTPAVVLQRFESARMRRPIALMGKVYCKVDASFGSISAGDLLTTSSTPGHAMRVLDIFRATGSILGKALAGMEDGRGLIPILVSVR